MNITVGVLALLFSLLVATSRAQITNLHTSVTEIKGQGMVFDVVVVGAGLSGTVIADLCARVYDKRVLVIEQKSHVGGRFFDFVDHDTGLLRHLYAPQFLHTNDELIWKYFNRFDTFVPYSHRVMAVVGHHTVPYPPTIDTVNALFGCDLDSVDQMQEFLTSPRSSAALFECDKMQELLTPTRGSFADGLLEEMIKKKWGRSKTLLDFPAGTHNSMRAHQNWDDRLYPDHKYQGIPNRGYTKWFEAALSHPNIRVLLNTDYFDAIHELFQIMHEAHVFYTGKIDQYFATLNKDNKESSSKLPALEYRAVRYSRTVSDVVKGMGFVQPVGELLFPLPSTPHTSCVDYRYLRFRGTPKALVSCETWSELTEAEKQGGMFSFGSDEQKEQSYDYVVVPDTKNVERYTMYRDHAVMEVKRLLETDNMQIRFTEQFSEKLDMDIDERVRSAMGVVDTFFDERVLENAMDAVDDVVANEAFTINLVVAYYREETDSINIACRELSKLGHLRVFINSKGGVDAETILADIPECNTSRPVVIHQENVGREAHAHLSFILGGSFVLADVNVFVQGSVEACNIHRHNCSRLTDPVAAIRKELFETGRTRESHEAVVNEDIREPTRKPSPHYRTLAVEGSGHWFQGEGSGKHVIEDYCRVFHENFPLDIKVQSDCFKALKSFRGEFVATDAGVRRMVARHATNLLKLQQSLCNAANLPAHYVERMWRSLFLGVCF